MAADVAIRSERPGDGPTISEVVIRAYAAVGYSDHREQLMIERLRETKAYSPELSLLAEIAGEGVGHILLIKAHVCHGGSAVTTLALAPLSVVPEFQSCGVGKALVRAAHKRAIDLGFDSIILVGIPGYYRQFGYQPLSDYPITLPFDAPDENCMILPLTPRALDGVTGVVRYPDGWLNH